MGSAGLLGGARGSIGRAGHSSIQTFLGQSTCVLCVDRENERRSRTNLGAVDSSEGVSCSFSGPRNPHKVARGGLVHDFTPSSSGLPRCSSSALGGLFSSSVPMTGRSGSSALENCSSVAVPSLLHTASAACQGWESTTARVLSSAGRFAPSLKVYRRFGSISKKGSRRDGDSLTLGHRRPTRAMAVSPDEGKKAQSSQDFRDASDLQMIEDWNPNQFIRNDSDAIWQQLNMITRVAYSVVMYGGLVVAGNAICSFTGVDCWGGFKPSIETFFQALGWAIPPMMVLLLILEDEVVKVCAPARAIRDVEDEELMDFFVGMNPWQFVFVVAAGSLSEELFFRVAIQGGLAHALQYTSKGADEATIGISALTTVIPFFAPFAQAFAAVLTASLTGSMYYVISSPKYPTYVVAPVSVNKYGWNNRRDIKKRIEAWYEQQQLKKIYSPLMEALLALYLGFEWVQTGNIFGPMITHTLYSLVVAGNGLRRILDNRLKLRQRVSKVTQQKSDFGYLDKPN